MDLMWFLIEHSAKMSAKNKYRLTPLHCALSCGHVDLTWLLVEYSANVSAKDQHQEKPTLII
jgi:ankyrin repeat protein